MKRMKAIDKFKYGVPLQDLKPGNRFECEDEHVDLLINLKRAVIDEEDKQIPDIQFGQAAATPHLQRIGAAGRRGVIK